MQNIAHRSKSCFAALDHRVIEVSSRWHSKGLDVKRHRFQYFIAEFRVITASRRVAVAHSSFPTADSEVVTPISSL